VPPPPKESLPPAFCDNCGLTIPEDQEFCLCGAERDAVITEDGTHPYQKIGGTLIYYLVIIILFVGWDLYNLLQRFIQPAQIANASTAATIGLFFSTMLSILFWIPFVQLLRRNPKFLKNFHIIYMIYASIRVLSRLIVYLGEAPAMGFRVPYSVIFFVALYIVCYFGIRKEFTRSERIRTYMGTHTYITTCPFARKVTPTRPAVPDKRSYFPNENNQDKKETTS